MSSWPPISRDDLKAAATSAGFDTVFPLLMRRLIAETADGLTSLDMPGGSGTAGGGFDGVVTATGQSTFVPSGTSVWELSVGGGQAKADEDYDKRMTGPDNLPTQTVAYVEALLVPWTKARAWAIHGCRVADSSMIAHCVRLLPLCRPAQGPSGSDDITAAVV